MTRGRCMLGLVALGCACGDSRNSVGLFGEGGIDEGGSSGASAADDDDDDGDDDDGDDAPADDEAPADDSGGPLFDVGGDDTGGSPGCVEGDCGCTAVDI